MAPQFTMTVTILLLGMAVLLAASNTGLGTVGAVAATTITEEQRLVAALKDPKVSQFILTSDVVLTASLPPSTKDFTLVGRCRDQRQRPRLCVVDGNGKFRGFDSEGYNVHMTDIHFKNMCDINGVGAVAYVADGRIRATRCVFESNKAFTAGALAVRDSPLTVTDCQFRNNWAVEAAGAIRVFSNGVGKVRRSVFSGNSAGESGGAARVYEGGLDFVDCKFHGNSARKGDGGAVIFGGDSAGVISRSEFVGNSARNGSGGAVEVEGETAIDNINFCSCTFRRNSAKTPGSFNVDIANYTRVTFCRNKPPGLRVDEPAEAVVNCTVCAKRVYPGSKKSH
ncbi:hypothetical protein CBR_g12390 [Chara braunii]|uniref:Right handed beta helix domain-containing protein n=1 Tax=Chara braunii TaxID=69332 RepID=A0A388KSB1_CHABU|nr:hypothetical protein CBR_g12390 [Chara braunii]|eukprot:GBG72823.1 hypothetical protein CBR_g12390 [Chara braunii]